MNPINTKLNISKYNNILFDNDGVLLDTNPIKERNITQSVSRFTNPQKTKKFVKYFKENNGIPREIKIGNFFSPIETSAILEEYSTINSKTLVNAQITAGLISFLEHLKNIKKKPYVISGGDEKEVNYLLFKKKLTGYFKEIKGGPKTKEENLIDLNLRGSTLYIGDSQIDYNLSKQFKLDFIFMYGYTQFSSWKNFFRDIEEVIIIRDFKELLIYIS